MKSKIFTTGRYRDVKNQVKTFLNAQNIFVSKSMRKSTRASGDAIQEILSNNFQRILGNKICVDYSSDLGRRAMADFSFKDNDGFNYYVDVKTHRENTKFNMPNLTSVARIAEFYKEEKNYFVILFVSYDIVDNHIIISDIKFIPIEFLDWSCLTLGALGWGQIQIANSNDIAVNPSNSRKRWMMELCDALSTFYPKEIRKIKKRITHFRSINDYWAQKN